MEWNEVQGDQKCNCKIIQALKCNQEDLVVDSEFYVKTVEGCKNDGSCILNQL